MDSNSGEMRKAGAGSVSQAETEVLSGGGKPPQKGGYKNYFTASVMAKIGILSALGAVLYIFKFPLSFMPFFLELHFSDVPALLGGFALGPAAGCIIVVMKTLIKLLFEGTRTVFSGEITDMLLGLSFVLPSAILYKRRKNIRRAIIGLAVGAAASLVTSLVANVAIALPLYTALFYNGDINALMAVCAPFTPELTKENFYGLYTLCIALPFNLLRCVPTALVTFFLYKRVSVLFQKF
jgi:riboflavin transporter FmnP